jgi:hypothetical protein
MVGGHAGGLKWYSMVSYAATAGDPIAPNYSFLDVDSANPAQNKNGKGSDVNQEQVIVEMEVSETEVNVNAYMFKYDESSDTITTPKYLYDSMTMVRKAPVVRAEIAGPADAVADTDEEIAYTVSYSDIVNANAFDTTVEYDKDVLEFVRAESAFDADALLMDKVSEPADNRARVITGLEDVIPQAGKQDVARFIFKTKKPFTPVDDTTVKLVNADTVRATIDNGKILTSKDVAAVIAAGEATTTFYSYERASDINKDGKVTLADLSLALGKYQSNVQADRAYDIDLSGVVDTLDYVIISSFIGKAA